MARHARCKPPCFCHIGVRLEAPSSAHGGHRFDKLSKCLRILCQVREARGEYLGVELKGFWIMNYLYIECGSQDELGGALP